MLLWFNIVFIPWKRHHLDRSMCGSKTVLLNVIQHPWPIHRAEQACNKLSGLCSMLCGGWRIHVYQSLILNFWIFSGQKRTFHFTQVYLELAWAQWRLQQFQVLIVPFFPLHGSFKLYLWMQWQISFNAIQLEDMKITAVLFVPLSLTHQDVSVLDETLNSLYSRW